MADISGIGKSQISLFRSGKRNVSSETLELLLDAVEKIQPGAQCYFCSVLARQPLSEPEITTQIRQMGPQEIAQILKVLADRVELDQLGKAQDTEQIPLSA